MQNFWSGRLEATSAGKSSGGCPKMASLASSHYLPAMDEPEEIIFRRRNFWIDEERDPCILSSEMK
jgi:hypothetical protein